MQTTSHSLSLSPSLYTYIIYIHVYLYVWSIESYILIILIVRFFFVFLCLLLFCHLLTRNFCLIDDALANVSCRLPNPKSIAFKIVFVVVLFFQTAPTIQSRSFVAIALGRLSYKYVHTYIYINKFIKKRNIYISVWFFHYTNLLLYN